MISQQHCESVMVVWSALNALDIRAHHSCDSDCVVNL